MSIPPTLAGFGLVLGALLMSFGVACAVCAAVLNIYEWWAFGRVSKAGLARAAAAAEELDAHAREMDAKHMARAIDALERIANNEPTRWDNRGRW